MTIETIPLPRERIRAAQDFQIRIANLHAWPDQEFTLEFEYNELMERWIWELRHDRMGRFWPKGVATLEYNYSAFPYMLCRFVDLGDNEAVTPRNLGRSVRLGVFPGPLGGSFHPDADIPEEREYNLLRRREWEPAL